MTKWNAPGAVLPAAPGKRDPELAPGGRCAGSLRPASAPEDRALQRRGWSPVGPYERFGATSVVVATSGADGMCRPNAYQAFVFVNGVFAGTLAPHPMDARTDGSLNGYGLQLYSAVDLEADFARYSTQDPLCCPHGTSSVTYQVTASARPSVKAVSATTHPNGP